MTDYELAQVRLNAAGISFQAEADVSGNPFWLTEKKPPSLCPPRGGERYFAWGVYFDASGKFIRFWGTPPAQALPEGPA